LVAIVLRQSGVAAAATEGDLRRHADRPGRGWAGNLHRRGGVRTAETARRRLHGWQLEPEHRRYRSRFRAFRPRLPADVVAASQSREIAVRQRLVAGNRDTVALAAGPGDTVRAGAHPRSHAIEADPGSGETAAGRGIS